jgi:hypothetical protein
MVISVDDIFKEKFSFLYQIQIKQLNENYENQITKNFNSCPEFTNEEYIKVLSLGCIIVDLNYKPVYMPLHYIKDKKKIRALELECDEKDLIDCLKGSLDVNGRDIFKPKLYIRVISRVIRFDDEICVRVIYGIG